MKYLWLTTIPLLLGGAALNGAPCGAGTLAGYVSLGATGCTLGSVNFTQFAIVPGQNFATVINPANVTVTPGGDATNSMLTLGLNQTASAGDLIDLIFRVRASGALTGASVTLNQASAANGGLVFGFLDVCANGNFAGTSPTQCPTTAKTALALAVSGGPNDYTDAVTFPTSNFFDIFFEVSLDGSTGTASLQSATLGVNAISAAAIPEPSTTALVVLGILAIGLLRSRRQQ